MCLDSGRLRYLKFTDLLDPKTKKTSVRVVDIGKPSYKVAREYMMRLEKADFTDAALLEKLAREASGTEKTLSADEFKARFAPAVSDLLGGL